MADSMVGGDVHPYEAMGERLPDAAVAAAVRTQVGVRPDAVRQLSGFVGNQDFLVTTGRGDFVLKAGDAHAVLSEAWACERARAVGVPAPEVVAVDADRDTLPLPYLLMRCLPGGPIDDTDDVDDADEALVAAGRWLRAVHEIEVEGYGLLTASRGPDGTWGQVRGRESTWADVVAHPLGRLPDLVAARILDESLAGRVRAAFAAGAGLLAYGRGGVLLHADLHPRHVFAEQGRLTGIIDWGDATAGDPAYEFGRYSRAGDDSLALVLRGYQPDRDEKFGRRIVLYRVLWSLYALTWEYAAGGDWFAGHVQAVRDGLRTLDA
ncbi:Predicted kinase, aminoglycoside phosphotransferase (APT) family [Actinopolymorpha cephalotaxi]|uniref:Aminoglycoside phosphotransferase (APT) family kinase protein n=1 Tax=Actinopolymorpha cephalotaxi TaxID=504797 RepID=A0A1I2K6P7_9ACTN|nr:aminoglycoside phosphotransferase family protein [Actinopolymorpha cephalotaxi]NYH85899.1 aminoglycoside phosphotransferase (APT) family kinase protein [Actinopolymorpha cephalotaxi]SFF62825.1 Predicted kinase, aminoglycoside phosphotransferase (APT) family [Actinopolymorpha cephalotaxi]